MILAENDYPSFQKILSQNNKIFIANGRFTVLQIGCFEPS